jgi:hypothetical protein
LTPFWSRRGPSHLESAVPAHPTLPQSAPQQEKRPGSRVVVRFQNAFRRGPSFREPRYEKLHNALVLMRTTRVPTLRFELWNRRPEPRTDRSFVSGDASIETTEAVLMGLRFTKLR